MLYYYSKKYIIWIYHWESKINTSYYKKFGIERGKFKNLYNPWILGAIGVANVSIFGAIFVTKESLLLLRTLTVLKRKCTFFAYSWESEINISYYKKFGIKRMWFKKMYNLWISGAIIVAKWIHIRGIFCYKRILIVIEETNCIEEEMYFFCFFLRFKEYYFIL